MGKIAPSSVHHPPNPPISLANNASGTAPCPWGQLWMRTPGFNGRILISSTWGMMLHYQVRLLKEIGGIGNSISISTGNIRQPRSHCSMPRGSLSPTSRTSNSSLPWCTLPRSTNTAYIYIHTYIYIYHASTYIYIHIYYTWLYI